MGFSVDILTAGDLFELYLVSDVSFIGFGPCCSVLSMIVLVSWNANDFSYKTCKLCSG